MGSDAFWFGAPQARGWHDPLASLRDRLLYATSGQRCGGTAPGAHAYRVMTGRSAEQPPVLPAELGRAVVPDAVADAGHVAGAVRLPLQLALHEAGDEDAGRQED